MDLQQTHDRLKQSNLGFCQRWKIFLVRSIIVFAAKSTLSFGGFEGCRKKHVGSIGTGRYRMKVSIL